MRLLAVLILITGVFLAPSVYAQGVDSPEIPEHFGDPMPHDQFGRLPCGDLMARLDYFLQRLTSEQGGLGVVVIRTPKEDFWYALFVESVVYGEIEFHRDDEKVNVGVNDIQFVKLEDPERSETTLWIIPPGAESPVSEESNLDLGMPEGTKPFKFRSTLKDSEIGYCNFGGEILQFQEMLAANPEAKGNIVIAARNLKSFEAKKAELESALTAVGSGRLKYFFKRSRVSYVEYWIVPKKAK